MGEVFREVREAAREHKARVLPERQAAIEALRASGFHVQRCNDGYRYRVNRRIDLFPVRRRFHDIQTNHRGGYRDPLECLRRLLGR